ncbi:hypothetical protein BDQ12DRAFT_686855 [Crucibulum laeve]|uniref:Uncharacterized protein n=1 Tax=Crucibulum laeve TaxID=68775 RepID=A0A5C3M5L9_9AGAR|nr:hypothetical protein BDQ12DRAFT_686855 [Crucibulum laeve]
MHGMSHKNVTLLDMLPLADQSDQLLIWSQLVCHSMKTKTYELSELPLYRSQIRKHRLYARYSTHTHIKSKFLSIEHSKICD